MSLKSEITQRYVDPDGLVTDKPDVTSVWSGGNQLLNTGTYVMLLKVLGDSDSHLFDSAVDKCKVIGKPGIYNKNPNRPDEITCDDLIGISVGSNVCYGQYSRDIYEYGCKHLWIFSNTGKLYFSAISRPWNVALYCIASGRGAGLFTTASLGLAILVDAIFGKDAGDKRLMWLTIKTVEGVSPLFDSPIRLWRKSLVKKFGSMQTIFTAIYGASHPFSIYSKDIL